MQNYKDQNNKVHVLDDAAFEYLLPAGCMAVTQEEADILNTPPPPTPEELAASAKVARAAALSSITVTTQSGKVFDGNETARNNMLCAITAAGIANQTSTFWRMADNTTDVVTLDEVKEALVLSITKAGEIYTAS